MGVEFVRSAFEGYWRFFDSQPNVLVKGQYYFIGDDVPHLPFFHDFGSDFWRDGDLLPVVGEENIPPPLGHDKRLPWAWVPGISVSEPPRAIPVGTATDFAANHTFPFTPAVQLLGGFDTRCIFPCATVPGKITQDLFCFAINDCGYLLAMALLQKYVESEDHASFTTCAQLLLGADAVITFDDGDAEFPPIAIVQTPRNNILIHSGTSTATQWRLQFQQAYNGPTDFGTFSTLPIWFRASTRALDLLFTLGANPALPFILHGHSYGACAVVVASVRFHAANPNVKIRVTTTGSPKPGDARLQAQLKQFPNLHVITTEDIVARIPPSNAMKAVLQLAFPLLPDAFFGTFEPYPEYLYLDASGDFRYGPYTDLPALQFLWIFTFAFVTGLINSVLAHFSKFYVLQIRVHCPCPELPFTNEWYLFNFDTLDCLVAPLLFNGAGDELRVNTGPPLLLLDGAGDGPRVDVPALLILDGQGGDGRTPAELKLNGQGDQVNVPEPRALLKFDGTTDRGGDSCANALEISYGLKVGAVFDYPQIVWYKIKNRGDAIRLQITSSATIGTDFFDGYGDVCPPTITGGESFWPADFVQTFPPSAWIYLIFFANNPGTYDFEMLVTDYSLEGLYVVGIILPFGGSSAPAGFLLCDGTAVSRTTYADLFAAIGTTWGVGDGSTTFNVPDMRGRSPLGAGTGSGLTPRTLAAVGGEETHVLSSGELATHTHPLAPLSVPVRLELTTGGTNSFGSVGTLGSTNQSFTQSTGRNDPHNTMHPFAVCTFIIKT